jgi:hypothetical protein
VSSPCAARSADSSLMCWSQRGSRDWKGRARCGNPSTLSEMSRLARANESGWRISSPTWREGAPRGCCPGKNSQLWHKTLARPHRDRGDLLDHLVGRGAASLAFFEAERLRSLEIDTQLKFGRLVKRDISGLAPLKISSMNCLLFSQNRVLACSGVKVLRRTY